ncbi:hypothetical protein GUITHDRAFT_90037 [Guillardia theta CCMP2712]|uniref:Uncharacterized protein n=1 Tax=Guillardia theta (strain CCMP2712) TaxID=905079 RepID=L1IJX4_GUITC|nr:hypothetical protein GUITHDRAFT_90037 [Guillardia theta CCMP2712]EKX36224.1 hypothetical protein GUITHDRAFT_90037 [Guillardia theta CCMP2712]|eukprot:XP_005823204.1 hypothetical protein GUITHDRAFT_90037 [Guillardia theta CCMP2712]
MSWTPARAAWLEEVGKLPWIKVQRRDLLHKLREKSRFSWTSVGLFFRKLVLERELIIPQAVIRANAQLTFQLEGAELTSQAEGAEAQARRMKLVRHSEDFELLDSLVRGELQNRVLCYDLLQFLDARRPKNVSLDDWNDLLLSKFDFQSVPGMGVLDIPDLEEQEGLLAGGAVVLGYLTLCAIAVGAFIATVYLQQVQEMGYMEEAISLLIS